MGEFYNILPWNNPYNDNNAVAMGMANGILQGQNNQLTWMNNLLGGMLTGSSAMSFIGTPGFPAALNPLDCLNSVSLSNLLTGGGNMFGLPAFGSGLNGFDFGGYWNNVNGTYNGNNGGGSVDGSTLKGKQINRLKALLEKIQKEDSSPLDIDFTEYKKAKTEDEKLAALKDIFNKINSSTTGHAKLQEYLRKNDKVKFYSVDKTEKDMTFDDALKTLGYPESSSALRDFADRIYSEGISALSSANDKGSILQIISSFNQAHKDEHLMMFVANKVNKAKDNVEKQGLVDPIRTLITTLIARAKDCKDPEVTKQADELNKLLSEYVPTEEKKADSSALAKFKKENLEKISKQFDKLYAMTKLSEAKKLNKAAKDLYGFTDDFSDTDENIVDDNFIISDIKKQLEEEKIDSNIVDTALEITGGSSTTTTVTSVADLTKDNTIVPVTQITSHKVYTNGTKNLNATKYYVEKDGNLYELKGVTGISGDKFKTKTGTVDIETAINTAIGGNALDLNDVKTYSDTLKTIQKHVDSGDLKELVGSGGRIYRSTKKNKKGQYNYFILKDNVLKLVKNPKFTGKNGSRIFNENSSLSGGLVDCNVNTDILMQEGNPSDEGDDSENIITTDSKKTPRKYGRELRKALYEDSKEEATKIMNNWKKLDDADDILDVINGYKAEKSDFCFTNEKFTAKYVDEICNSGKESEEHIKSVAEQILKVVDNKDLKETLGEDKYDILCDLADGSYKVKWYQGLSFTDFIWSYSTVKTFVSPNIKKARILDDIIDEVVKLTMPSSTES